MVGPRVKIMAVIKADAYGHGAVGVARALAEAGADWFGVSCVEEALPLRRAGIAQPLFLFSSFWPGQEDALGEERLVPSVFTSEQLRLLECLGRRRRERMRFHLKVDTGMGRLGIAISELGNLLDLVRACEHVCLDGVYTHLASADEASLEQTHAQLEAFGRVRAELRRRGFDPPHVHAANSAALARCPESHASMVRPGLALYGYQLCPSPLRLRPVLRLKSRVVSLRDVPKGTPLGYGATYVTPGPARIAAVCAGYADGVTRALSNRGRAVVRGRFAPIVGRVNMDFTLLDVTGIAGVETGNEVVFIGRDGEAEVTATEVAALAGTVPYEILCNIGPRVPRVYLE